MSISNWFKDIWFVFCTEINRIFHDSGVMLIFFGAGLIYPIIYNLIYFNDDLEEVPIAVVDARPGVESRRFIHNLEASPLVKIAATPQNMYQAKQLMVEQKVHGIVHFPDDYNEAIKSGNKQAHIDVFNDMSTFLYMKNVTSAVNFVMLNTMHDVQIQRYNMMGMVGEPAEQLVQAVPYSPVALFSTGGYSSFLVPAILVLIIHQTLFFGIGMLGGTAREENSELYYLPGKEHQKAFARIILGRALAYMLIYLGISFYCLIFIPRLFHLPHVGNLLDIIGFIIPFLIATINFCMTVSVFVRHRETGMITLLATTLILVFISGFSWPHAAMPTFWRYVSYMFPSTLGVNAFLHINTMGAHIGETMWEIRGLWIQSAIYLLTATLSLQISAYKDKKKRLAEQQANTIEYDEEQNK